MHCSAVIGALLSGHASLYAATVTVVGLFPNKAVVVINGTAPRTISVGKKQAEDVTLISTAAASAVFDIEGKREVLEVGEHFAVASSGTKPGAGNVLTMAADSAGHFWALGQVNGKTVRFLVDTGATTIALPADVAKGMGIDYTKGQRGQTATAGGIVPVYRVKLDTVTIGGITLYQIDATIIEGGLDVALLGMSFLNRLEMKREGVTMTLTKRF